MLLFWRGFSCGVSVRRARIGCVAFNHAGVSDIFPLSADACGVADEVFEVVEAKTLSGPHLLLLVSPPPPFCQMRQPLLDDDAAIIKSVEELALFERCGGGVCCDELREELEMSCVVSVLDDGTRRQLPDDGHDRITPCPKHFVKF